MRQTFEEMLTDIIRPEIENLGLIFWGLSSPPSGKKRVVRIYIDGEDGVHIDQCAHVSRQVGLMLEVEDVIPGAFTLEVSSPGLERRFFTPEQMVGYIGRTIKVTLVDPVADRRKLKGELVAVKGDTITMTVDEETMDIDWLSIKKARLIHEF
ncbi:ribosome maturation factor RimP [Pseudodesulfovibrio sediminis]|uniref:Ribosome maturation factor RimP n=1 Tax=Pseudodesulfovibrio sediminis TaxID=2810563 RepID=A0ABN6EL96_9BACT|nr:ribosome maturation factor RimP [Pseudodesulfovibrio sediminis]BCS86805.1 ribosome maturation factor RimP [Pseudodesulfovibrio sediminis]